MLKFQYSGRTWQAAVVVSVGLACAVAQGVGGYYRVDARNGAQWLISPAGDATLLLGVNHVHLISASAPQTDLEPAYVDQRTAAIVAGLRREGFNTLGGDTDADVWHRGMAFVESLDISSHLQADQQTPMVDVYDPGFAARVQSLAQIACTPRAEDHELVGYLSDDGLSWDPALQPAAVLAYYLQLPLDAAGRQRSVDYLRDRYGSDISRLNRAWGIKASDFIALAPPAAGDAAFARDAAPFAAQVLVRYLQVTADAIHAADPNHLYLGANLRFDPATAPAAGTAAALAWSIPDVASVSLASDQDAPALLARLQQVTARPLLVEERGCGTAAASAARLFSAAELVGYVWSPAGDWQSGECAGQATATWAPLNQQAATSHRR